MNIRHSLIAPVFVALGAASVPAAAQETSLYYRLGGARPVSSAASLSYNYYTSVDLFAGGGFSCGKFNLKESVSQLLNNVSRAADQYQQAMVQAAQSAIASLPMLILQRVNPGLYDIFQNALLDAKAGVNLSVASCQQMENDIAAGRNPYRNWIRWGRWQTWQDEGLSRPNDVSSVDQTVRDDGGERGVPWVCGSTSDNRAGGQGQRPIQPVHDAVVAGYNVILNRASNNDFCNQASAPVNSSNAPPGAVGQQLGDTFPTPEDAAKFAIQVLGDTKVYTYDGAPQEQMPGTGILPYVERESTQISQRLQQLASVPIAPTVEDRKDVGAPGLEISNQLIRALKEYDPNTRAGLVHRLSDEVAVHRMIERMLLVRRMLLSARDVAVVRNAPPALDQINESIQELTQQIEDLSFEAKVRKELVSDTALVILGREGARRLETPASADKQRGGRFEAGGFVPKDGGN